MIKTLDAIFDGKVLHPEAPLDLIPNTKVKITIEVPATEASKPVSFLDTAQSLMLEGPEDLSEKLDDYLYGGLINDNQK
jgi:hypothetical protein